MALSRESLTGRRVPPRGADDLFCCGISATFPLSTYQVRARAKEKPEHERRKVSTLLVSSPPVTAARPPHCH